MDINQLLQRYEYSVIGFNPNQYAIKSHQINMDADGIEEFNNILNVLKASNLNELKRTPSGSIRRDIRNRYAWDCRTSKVMGIITVIDGDKGYSWTIAHKFEQSKIQKGWQAFKLFNKECKKNGIDLEDMTINNGLEVKEDISSPIIDINSVFYNSTLTKVHHIDFHSSYAAGLMNTHPVFEKTIRHFYINRKKNPAYKLVLNATIGYMQSAMPQVNARWAHLSKDAIEDNNERLLALALRISYTKRVIVGFNTDGLWYMGDIYHGDGEGSDIGQWSNDYTNCTFRAKSSGCYEFIYNGVYFPVVRGITSYDKIKDRSQWEWGDIFKGETVTFKFDKEKGIITNEENIK